MAKSLLQATDAFSLDLPNGAPLNVNKGDMYWSDDPIMKGRESLFEEVKVKSSMGPESPISASLGSNQRETATASPGERRSVTPRPKGAEGRQAGS